MKLDFGKTRLKINASFAAAVTLMLILDESGLCAVALFCCIAHESGHIICLMLSGEYPKLIELSFYGIKLERIAVQRGGRLSDFAVYASGPAANFVLSAILFLLSETAHGMRTAAVISLGVGLFNLIPCRPLDGGNILFCILTGYTEEKNAVKICRTVSLFLLIPMGITGIVLIMKSGNFTLLAMTAYLAAVCFGDKHE